ncbi:hypothetical protein MPTK1_4g13740 [Marchantia polymorpha subsp. ruderalis]|uniref:Uncharacterized protein n=2 Tax=Marchantia polymorpha TaxID=3197 RepID=A0AAF6B9L8_MARPO|nr:hypothetical protein MARPO_0202s0015 [Marchantia polymorpha]BBN08702.1 hypothetical protein Mp_4g13740 [Marchantia polymorpha subsp. ruderalis]|eukprot:PTQ27388.1 hypothetical protein MARPO_0202s0015 [Marchantia polymorpha]
MSAGSECRAQLTVVVSALRFLCTMSREKRTSGFDRSYSSRNSSLLFERKFDSKFATFGFLVVRGGDGGISRFAFGGRTPREKSVAPMKIFGVEFRKFCEFGGGFYRPVSMKLLKRDF